MKRTLVLGIVVLIAATAFAQEPYSIKADKLGETLGDWRNNNIADLTTPFASEGCPALIDQLTAIKGAGDKPYNKFLKDHRAQVLRCADLKQSLDKICSNDTVTNYPGSPVDPDVVYCFPPSGDNNLTFANAPLLSETSWFYKGHLYKVEMTLRNTFGLPDLMTALGEKFGKPASHEVTQLQNGFAAQFEQDVFKWNNGVSTLELSYSLKPDECPTVVFTLDAPNREVTERQKNASQRKATSDM